MHMATAFSSSGEDAITRSIDVQVEQAQVLGHSTPEFDDFYEIGRTASEIIKGGYKRVALQFPDELLRDSVPIYRKLKSMIAAQDCVGVEMYVLADTSYGSCCVDEVAAQHVDADAIIHYGHACMSQTYRLPVVYVFGRKPVDVCDCVERFVEILTGTTRERPEVAGEGTKTVIFRHNVAFTHRADEIVEKLREQTESLGVTIAYSHVPTRLDPPGNTTPAVSVSATQDIGEHVIFYLGGECLALTNLLMTHASSQVYSYHPETKTTRLESARTNKLLMRRYVAMQKARDADVFGILVGTLGVAHYLPLIAHIRALISRKRKKCYTISVGKLNPAKLANFMEIECFVFVACPENSIVEAKEFLRPIVTPYELEIALQPDQGWTGRYVLDFGKLLAEDKGKGKEGDNEETDDDMPVFSLVTGTYRHPKKFGVASYDEEPNSSAVILRNQEHSLAKTSDSAAGQFLQSRTYRGLETRIGEEPPSILEQGRSGIARDYQGG